MARSRLALNAAVLGLVFVAVAFVLAVPLRNYFSQRNQLDAAVATEQAMNAQKASLQQQRTALSDPFYLANEARQRLQFVTPGDTVYVVHAPALPNTAAPAPAKQAAQTPWYSKLWDTVSDPAVQPVAAPAQPAGRAGG
jgi:cell division protein FtsB